MGPGKNDEITQDSKNDVLRPKSPLIQLRLSCLNSVRTKCLQRYTIAVKQRRSSKTKQTTAGNATSPSGVSFSSCCIDANKTDTNLAVVSSKNSHEPDSIAMGQMIKPSDVEQGQDKTRDSMGVNQEDQRSR